ncbi:NTE family protein [Nakamurella sp. UYEF19]|uniref:patatin-like phospholipase family protein n=1 Tax=Nakamurella sp. UYEF19 TaxID=1756392 RepID=UPI0033929813
MVQRALVLAGGGVAGIAWELGVLLGIREGATDLAPPVEDADLVVGTSAGSTVAAQISTGTDLQSLYDRQLLPTSSEIEVDFDLEAMMATFAEALAASTSPEDMRRRIGALALAADTVTEAMRKRAVGGRLLVQQWSDRAVLIPAIDAETGELVVFTRESGVDLVDAVTASCAVPGVWPPATINGRRYIDGGTRSGTNADLALGADRVLIITPAVATAEPFADQLAQEIAELAPATVFVVSADDAALEAFGLNPLSPATRAPSATAGRALGNSVADRVKEFWA